MTDNHLDEGEGRGCVMLHRFRDSSRRGRGATATELIILLVLIALVTIGVFKIFGGTIKEKLTGAQAGVSAVGTEERRTSSDFDSSKSSSSAADSDKSGSSAKASRSSEPSRSGSMEGKSVSTSSSVAVKAEGKPGSVGGFNPWILVIFLGLAGLLVYVFFAKKSN